MKDEYIDQMYGSDESSEQPAKEEPVEAADDYGYEKPPEKPQGNPYALPENSGSLIDDLYGAESKVTLSDDTDLSVIYQSKEEQAALRQNLGHMAAESGATQSDVHSLVTHANQQLITGANADPTESMSTLYEQHGSDLGDRLGDARQLVNSFPELVDWLESTKLGNDPKIINHFIRIAQTPRAQARLQQLKGTK